MHNNACYHDTYKDSLTLPAPPRLHEQAIQPAANSARLRVLEVLLSAGYTLPTYGAVTLRLPDGIERRVARFDPATDDANVLAAPRPWWVGASRWLSRPPAEDCTAPPGSRLLRPPNNTRSRWLAGGSC